MSLWLVLRLDPFTYSFGKRWGSVNNDRTFSFWRTITLKQSEKAFTYMSSMFLRDCSFGFRDLCPRERNTLWIKSKVFLSCGGYSKLSAYISPKSSHMASGRFSILSITMAPSRIIAVCEFSKCSACEESWLPSVITVRIPMEIWGMSQSQS